MSAAKHYIRPLIFCKNQQPMNTVDKKEYFAFLDKWFKIYPESIVTHETKEVESTEFAEKKSS